VQGINTRFTTEASKGATTMPKSIGSLLGCSIKGISEARCVAS